MLSFVSNHFLLLLKPAFLVCCPSLSSAVSHINVEALMIWGYELESTYSCKIAESRRMLYLPLNFQLLCWQELVSSPLYCLQDYENCVDLTGSAWGLGFWKYAG